MMNEASRRILLPLLATSVKLQYLERLKKVTFVGHYILLHYEYEPSKAFINYEDYLTKHSLFKKLLDNGNMIIYSFEIPKEYIEDIKLFGLGRIKDLSDDAKNIILRYLISKKDTLAVQKLRYFWAPDEEAKAKAFKAFLVPPKNLENLEIDIKAEKFDYIRDLDLGFEERTRKKLGFE